jgi:TonB family protein
MNRFGVSAAIALVAMLQAFPAPMQLVSEHTGLRSNFSVKLGLVELRGGPGWLRTTRLFSDFKLTLDFRRIEPDTEAAIILRGWITGRGDLNPAHQRVTLPTSGAPTPSALVGPQKDVRLTEEGDVVFGDEWQRLEVVADGPVLRVMLNGTLVGAYDVEPLAGYVLFTAARGAVQMRDVQIVPIEHPFPEDAPPVDAIVKQGGEAPRAVRWVGPEYSVGALERKAEGLVTMDVVVLNDGSVGPVRVIRSLDPDLDLIAAAAVRRWRFAPATLNGAAVTARAVTEMSFTIRARQ